MLALKNSNSYNATDIGDDKKTDKKYIWLFQCSIFMINSPLEIQLSFCLQEHKIEYTCIIFILQINELSREGERGFICFLIIFKSQTF